LRVAVRRGATLHGTKRDATQRIRCERTLKVVTAAAKTAGTNTLWQRTKERKMPTNDIIVAFSGDNKSFLSTATPAALYEIATFLCTPSI